MEKNTGIEFLKNLDLGSDSPKAKKNKKPVRKAKNSPKTKESSKSLPDLELRFTRSLSLFQSDLDRLETVEADLREKGIKLNQSQILRLSLHQFQFDPNSTEDLSNDILEHYRRHKRVSSETRKKAKRASKKKTR